jgi:hypothetical protein
MHRTKVYTYYQTRLQDAVLDGASVASTSQESTVAMFVETDIPLLIAGNCKME